MTYLFNDIQRVSKDESANATTNRIYVDATVSSGEITVLPDFTTGNFHGEPYAIDITPVVQIDGRYGINPLDIQVYTSGGGTATSELSCFKATCTATIGSYTVISSRRFNSYKAGQSLLARGYLRFATPAAGTTQRWGLANQENAYYIGYDGLLFGMLHVYDGRTPLYKLTITSYTANQTVTLTLNGTAYTISILTGESIQSAAQRISIANFNGTWLTTQRGNTVEFLYTGALAPLDGAFSVSSSGNLVGAVSTIQAGVVATNVWIYPGDVDDNGNVFSEMPAWFNGTAFNQYQVKYSWAGSTFFILNPTTGRYFKFFSHYHIADGITQPQISNPAFKVVSMVYNTGGSSGVSIHTGEMSLFLEGSTIRNNYSRGAAVTQSSLAADGLHHLLSIQNAFIFNNTINTTEVVLQDFTVSMQCNDPTEIYMFIDARLTTGVHDFQVVAGHVAGVSKATGLLDIAANEPIASFIVSNTGSSTQFEMVKYRVVVPPGSTLTVAARSTAVMQRAACALVWYTD
jgi:hypothetical protein